MEVNALDSAVERSHKIAAECLATSLPRRWSHVQGVARRAEAYASLCNGEDGVVLVCAALLHDVGYAHSLFKTGLHALDGAIFLSRSGFDLRICSLVAHHSCARLEACLRGLNKNLYRWSDEGGHVRDALWWADMTTTPDGAPTNVRDRIREIQERYGPEDLITRFIQEARPYLIGAVERTEERLRAAGLGHLAK